MIPDLKIEEARMAHWIIEAWGAFALCLMVSSLVVGIVGGVKNWPFKKVWVVILVGWVGASLIFDVVLAGAGGGYGDQPTLIASLVGSPVVAAVCLLIGAIIYRCSCLFRRRKGLEPPRLSFGEIMAEFLHRLPLLALLLLTILLVSGGHFGTGAICMLIGAMVYGCSRLFGRSKETSGPTPPVPQ